MLEVGRVVRPHGLKGQVVVELWSNRPERTAPGALLWTDTRPLILLAASKLPERDRWLATFDGLGDREGAEELRNAVLCGEPIDDDGALWIHQLIGAPLHDTAGHVVGTVQSVQANPASDLLVLADGSLVPLTFVTKDDAGRLVVDAPPGLFDG